MSVLSFYAAIRGKGCDKGCVEDFHAIMEYTGWSQDTVFVVFFIGIFVLLLLIVFALNKFRPRTKHRKYPRKF